MAKAPDVTVKQISEVVMNEILCAFVEAKINPSSDLFKLLSKLAGKTEVIVKEQYNVLHKNNTGTDDDPFTSPLPFIG